MPKITFKPADTEITVPAGTPLFDAAKQAGVSVSVPCGCKGVCGKCLVLIESGEVETPPDGTLSKEMAERGAVLICRAKVGSGDAVVVTSSAIVDEKGKFDGAPDFSLIDPVLLPNADEITPLVERITLTLPAPKYGDGLPDLERLKRSLAPLTGEIAEVPLAVLRSLPDAMRSDNGAVTVYCYDDNGAHVVDIRPGVCSESYGIAVDIGTTTIAVGIADESGRLLACKTGYNRQIECGLDVISRINYARKPERLEELRQKVLATINELTYELTSQLAVMPELIHSASIAGNTTMIQLLLGIPPEALRLDPYVPAIHDVPLYRAAEVGLTIHPCAPVLIAPAVGSYVGGDITAGALTSTLAQDSEEVCLFIDIGTNGEILLGNSDFLLGCACSAGPAFEGGGIKHGMRASQGAIERVSVDHATGEANISVIGDAPPTGICGSGIISLIAQLYRTGYLDAAGKLREKPSKIITIEGKNAYYTIAPAEGGRPAVTVSEADIDNFIRAKAAIFSACQMMLSSVSMDFSDLSRIYIAGGFGRYLNLEDASTIGLIPNLPDKFSFIGNSSFMGAYMALISKSHREKMQEIADRITYMDLSSEPGYMDHYIAALFIPHTDRGLFS